jgi:iron complex transport system ATP-binding protein
MQNTSVPGSSILEVENLSFGYHDRMVLNGVSFSVKRGEVCGLLGPNGCGKTTLLKCINRILHARSGSIRIHGRDVSGLSRNEIASIVAVVPQDLHVIFSFTVLEMVLMGGTVRYGFSGIPQKKDYMRACEILEELHISGLADRRYNELSGGEKQVVLIARALFQGAEIMLLDEPTSHLDFKRQHMTMEMIKRISVEKGLTTLITLHDPNTAGRYCHRLVMLNRGCVCHQGPRDSIFHAGSLESVYDMKINVERTDTGSDYVVPHSKPVNNEKN